MAAKLKDMSIIKQIFRLYQQGHSIKGIVRLTGVSKNTVKKYLRLSEVSPHRPEELLGWDNERLEEFFSRKGDSASIGRQGEVDELLPYFEQELKRPGVTKWILWGEYRQSYPEGYGYSKFCDKIRRHFEEQKCSYHIDHLPADKVFIDFAGKKLPIADKETGEVTQLEVFVAILGYSQLTYVEAVRSQKQEDFISACVNALHYFGGSPKAIVCDNLKSAVDRACRYEPSVNETFTNFANHYQMAVIPARSRKPQDKSPVENAVKIAYQRLYAPLRNQTFYSITEINKALQEKLLLHNQTQFQNKDYSRRDVFEKEERTLLQPLPQDRFQMKNYREVTVMKNCHIQLREDFHYYSVPYRYIGKKTKLIYTKDHVMIFYHGEQVAFHIRDYRKYKYTTVKEHLPSHHQFVSDWNPEMFLNWAGGIAPVVQDYIRTVLERKVHPEQAYKSCSGILALARKAGKEELIAACTKATQLGVFNYSFIKRMIENGYAKQESGTLNSQGSLPFHDNIRGSNYYQ